MRERAGHFAKDAIELAELQAKLLQVELMDWLRRGLVPAAVLATVAATLCLAALPLLLLALAYCLHEFVGLSMSASALIASAAGLTVAVICLVVAWRLLKRQRGAFTRFRVELTKNARWLKQMLTRPGTAAGDEPW
jgi:hypothetical protein